MPNIILERDAVPELIGLNCRPHKIAQAVIRILTDTAARNKMLRDYALIRQALGSELLTAPTERTAQIVEEMLSEVMEPAEAEPVAV
jgi:lipid A disaccharide synthetase